MDSLSLMCALRVYLHRPFEFIYTRTTLCRRPPLGTFRKSLCHWPGAPSRVSFFRRRRSIPNLSRWIRVSIRNTKSEKSGDGLIGKLLTLFELIRAILSTSRGVIIRWWLSVSDKVKAWRLEEPWSGLVDSRKRSCQLLPEMIGQRGTIRLSGRAYPGNGVGLIFRLNRHVKFDQTPAGCLGTQLPCVAFGSSCRRCSRQHEEVIPATMPPSKPC